MEARKKRNIKPGLEYDHLFPRSENDTSTIRKNANVYHTVDFIPKVVQETLDQTKQIAQRLKGSSVYETCKNIWHFVYQHINYKKDQEGYEQIRSPARAWHDRQQGVDCDCYSVFLSSILTNLGIPHILRITKYHRDYFQHIYPVVLTLPRPSPKEREIVIDCVTDKFDYEVPFSEKKDYPMDLQYLNGFDGDGLAELNSIIERNMTMKPNHTELEGLFKKKKKKPATPSPEATPGSSATIPAPAPKKKKGFFKKVLNVVNKVNPVTVLLRNGVLAAMKLNIKNVAKRLRWSYLSPDKIAAHGIDPVRFQKLVTTRQKLENIFYGAGGKPDNLRKAILGGKGNKDKAVSGLGMLPMQQWSGYMNEYTPLGELLGDDIYYSENIQGMEGFQGFGELGEPVTLASVGAAMGVVAGIVAALKQVGDIFKKKEAGSADFDEEQTDAPENNVNIPVTAQTTASIQTPASTSSPLIAQNTSPAFVDSAASQASNTVVRSSSNYNPPAENETSFSEDEIVENKIVSSAALPVPITNNNNAGDNPGNDKEGFWNKNKKWIKPVAIGVGGLTIIAIGYKMFKGHKDQNKSSPKQSLSGVPSKRKKKKKNHHRKQKHHYKKAVALI